MAEVAAEVQAEYERIHARARADPGTAGDDDEKTWAALLRDWLPPQYPVVTKGRLLAADGRISGQVDVIVLSPSYPTKLREKSVYLIDGVVAVLECKLAVRSGHIRDAFGRCIEIKRMARRRSGSPYRELLAPPIYGLLARTHHWNATTARQVVRDQIVRADSDLVGHPREMPDLFCIGSLGTWFSLRVPHSATLRHQQDGDTTSTLYVGPRNDPRWPYPGAVGVALSVMLDRIAGEDPSVRGLAAHWIRAGMAGGFDEVERTWPFEIVFSEPVRQRMPADLVDLDDDVWSEWGDLI
jgi:hypothetical protein